MVEANSEERPKAPTYLVMGVAGSGKTTIGTLLAERLGWVYAEADDFHPPANRAKMVAGKGLDDADRKPWLEAIGAWIDEAEATGLSAVVTCSALKRAYRDALRAGRPHLRVFYLLAPLELLSERLSRRAGHFFPPELLASQLRDLEPPQPDEEVVSIPVEGRTPEQIVDRIISEA